MKKQVMVRAWELAREGAKKFGGKVKDFFKSALAIAWAEIKEGVKVATERAQQLIKSLNISEELAERLVEVEQAYRDRFSGAEDEYIKFNVWKNKRVYITCPWCSKYYNKKGNYVDMETLEVHAQYIEL